MELTERLHKHEHPPATVQNDVGPVSHPPYHRQRRGPALMPILIQFPLKNFPPRDARRPSYFKPNKEVYTIARHTSTQVATLSHAAKTSSPHYPKKPPDVTPLATLGRLKNRVSLQNLHITHLFKKSTVIKHNTS